jgi:Type II restriction enzyme SfiI
MFIDPQSLETDPARLEEVEKASMRLVTHAVYDFRETAAYIFANEKDKVADIGEDITREALDQMGVSRIDERLFGKVDYKKARYVFHPEYALRQALFVDSKAEKVADQTTATLQTAQTSLRIRHTRAGIPVDEAGTLPRVLVTSKASYLTTTIIVKYGYQELAAGDYRLAAITVAALPNGMLQGVYNPSAIDTIWRAGRNAPTRGEPFRVRLVFGLLKAKMNWRVQAIPMASAPFTWED